MIAVGSKAPDFILKDQDGKQVQLSELKGKKVLLSFHPLAWTKVCAEQMKSLEANYERFEKLNSTPLGFIVDTRHADQYEVDHIKGAISVPLDTITSGGWMPPLDKEIIFYCG